MEENDILSNVVPQNEIEVQMSTNVTSEVQSLAPSQPIQQGGKRKRKGAQRTLLNFSCFTQQNNDIVESFKGDNASSSSVPSDVTHDPTIISIEIEKEKRRQLWKESWTSTFEWAYFDIDQARIFCKICKNDNTCKSEFGKRGSINIQHNALTEHARTRAHKDAAILSHVQGVSIEDSMNRSRLTADRAVLNLFATAYHIAKFDSSLASFRQCLNLMQFCECPTLGKEIYSGDKACQTFIKFISLALLKQTIKRVKASQFYTLMLDESTDVGKVPHMIVYAGFIEDFHPKTCFLGLVELEGSSSNNIYQSLTGFLSTLGLSMGNIVSLGTDGATTMTGRVNGLAAKLKQLNPFMTSIHCVAHRANLCLVDAIKRFPMAEEIDVVVNDIAAIFTKSAKQTAILRSLEEEFGCQDLKMSRIHKVRWLSRANVLHKVCESFEPLLVFLKQHSPTIYAKITNFQFVYSIHFMADILERLAALSKIFQSDYVDISSVFGLIEAEIIVLTEQFIDLPEVDINSFVYDGLGYHIIPDYGPMDGKLAALRASIRGPSYRSIKLNRLVDNSDMEAAIQFQKQFCNLIIMNMKERFPESGIVSCFKVLSPAAFPKTKPQLRNFGVVEIETLASFYGEEKFFEDCQFDALVKVEQLKREFQLFKAQAPYEWQDRSIRDTWVSIGRNPTQAAKYPNLLTLAHICMIQCGSTSICERGFSIQNIIKTKERSSMKTKTLDSLMRISIEGPNDFEEVDFDTAIQLWKTEAKTSRHIYGPTMRLHKLQRK